MDGTGSVSTANRRQATFSAGASPGCPTSRPRPQFPRAGASWPWPSAIPYGRSRNYQSTHPGIRELVAEDEQGSERAVDGSAKVVVFGHGLASLGKGGVGGGRLVWSLLFLM